MIKLSNGIDVTMTVGELKKALESISDDEPVIIELDICAEAFHGSDYVYSVESAGYRKSNGISFDGFYINGYQGSRW